MVVSSLRLVNFRSYCDATVRFGPGPQRGRRRERHRQDQPARGGVVRVARQLPAHAARREAHHLGGAVRPRGARARRDGRRHAARRRRLRAGAGQARALGGRSRSRRSTISVDAARCSSSCPRACCWSRAARRGGAPTWTPSPPRSTRSTPPQHATCRACCGSATRSWRRSRTAPNPAALDPWDTQFARVAAELGRRRRDLVDELAAQFAEVAAALAPAGERFTVRLAAQLEAVGYDEAALLEELRARRPGEVGRGLSLYGPHRDDLKFLEVGAADAGAERQA